MRYVGEYTKEISFPLGGIGTGSVGLGGDGRLIDWEIFNRPAKGSLNGFSHFAIRAIDGKEITAKVLNGDMIKNYMGQYRKTKFGGYGYGPDSRTMCGFPGFRSVVFNGEFPIANLEFEDETFPGRVIMKAFNPFIPLDADNSSIPAAFFEIEVENTADEDIKYQIALSITNPYKKSYNTSNTACKYKSITLCNANVDKDDIEYGDLTFTTDCVKTYVQTYWYRGGWQDKLVSYWNEFSEEPNIKERDYTDCGENDTATLVTEIDVSPNEKKNVRFVLAWNVPNNCNYWSNSEDNMARKSWKNYYATVFENSEKTAFYALDNWNELYERTLKFKDVLHNSTFPKEVIDAASANLSVLKSPTVWRLEDGSFYGWEGVHELEGSCEGTCQHVWNYAYAMCFLFPELERSVRDTEFKYNTDCDGRMAFRTMLPLGTKMTEFRACVDGQMGAVIKCYREWKLSGDDVWLKNNWDNIKKVLEYAWSKENDDAWDLDKDGVLEGRQHHTLDMELFGPSSWLEGMYLAALKAAAEMGEYIGDKEKAEEYRQLFDKGYEWTKENLFNGKYFVQKVDITNNEILERFDASERYWNSEAQQIKYQIWEGSSIDQMLAQWHADIIGLGQIFDKKQIDCALTEMMKNNYKPAMREVVNAWRIFSLNDEAGTVICDYPCGAKKPKVPVPYSDETMTGFEYSFAGLLCAQGRTADGLKVVKAVRDRFDGKKRNPWNEFECGSNYARSMASYALIPILSGFEFDLPRNYIGFNPYKTDEFSSVWSVCGAYGSFEIRNNAIKLRICEGKILLETVGLKFCDSIECVKIDGKTVDFKFKEGKIYFERTNITDCVEIII